MKPTAIIGVGNFLMSDEGVGIHAISELRKFQWPDSVEIIDGGTPGVALLHMMEKRKLVMLIDCADFDGKPGEIRTFDPEDLERDENSEISLHATDLLGALALAKSAGSYPEKVIIVGIQPEKIEMGTTLSAPVARTIKSISEFIMPLIPQK